MAIEAFVDESGGKGQGKIFVMAGWLAEHKDWIAFSREWAACLNAPPKLEYFKMREAASRRGQLCGFSEKERDRKVRLFANIVRRHAKAAFHCSVDLDAFSSSIEPLGKPFSDPYFWPFHITIMAVCLDLVERGVREPFEIVFDEHSIFGPRAKPWYPLVRALMMKTDPEDAAIMPSEPLYRSDSDCLPIQASDMLAWLLRRSFVKDWGTIEQWEDDGSVQHSSAPHEGSDDFAWVVDEELRFVEMSSHSQLLTRRRLAGIVERMNVELSGDLLRDPNFREIRRLYSELFA